MGLWLTSNRIPCRWFYEGRLPPTAPPPYEAHVGPDAGPRRTDQLHRHGRGNPELPHHVASLSTLGADFFVDLAGAIA